MFKEGDLVVKVNLKFLRNRIETVELSKEYGIFLKYININTCLVYFSENKQIRGVWKELLFHLNKK